MCPAELAATAGVISTHGCVPQGGDAVTANICLSKCAITIQPLPDNSTCWRSGESWSSARTVTTYVNRLVHRHPPTTTKRQTLCFKHVSADEYNTGSATIHYICTLQNYSQSAFRGISYRHGVTRVTLVSGWVTVGSARHKAQQASHPKTTLYSAVLKVMPSIQ